MTVDTHLTLVRPSHGQDGLNNSSVYSTTMALSRMEPAVLLEITVVAASGLHHEGVGSWPRTIRESKIVLPHRASRAPEKAKQGRD
jgi:hypothetical protein